MFEITDAILHLQQAFEAAGLEAPVAIVLKDEEQLRYLEVTLSGSSPALSAMLHGSPITKVLGTHILTASVPANV